MSGFTAGSMSSRISPQLPFWKTAGRLDKVEAEWDRRFALGVVMAAAGYPEDPRKGDLITGLPDDAEPQVGEAIRRGRQVFDEGSQGNHQASSSSGALRP